jgi:hypothetical protein
VAAAILDGSFGAAWRDACRDAVARAALFVLAVLVAAGRAADLRAVRRPVDFFAAARDDLRVAFAAFRAVFRPPALVRFAAAALRAGRFAAVFRDPFFAAFFAALFAKSLLLSGGVRADVPG